MLTRIQDWIKSNDAERYLYLETDGEAYYIQFAESASEDLIRKFVIDIWELDAPEEIQSFVDDLLDAAYHDLWYDFEDNCFYYLMFIDDDYLFLVDVDSEVGIVNLDNDVPYLNSLIVVIYDWEYSFNFNERYIVNNSGDLPEGLIDDVREIVKQVTFKHSDAWRGYFTIPASVEIRGIAFELFDEGFSSIDGLHHTKHIKSTEDANKYDSLITLVTRTTNCCAVDVAFYLLRSQLEELKLSEDFSQ